MRRWGREAGVIRAVDRALGPIIHQACTGSAKSKLKGLKKDRGLEMWKILIFQFSARSEADYMNLQTAIATPKRARDFDELVTKLDAWDGLCDDCDNQFPNKLSLETRKHGLYQMIPERILELKFAGEEALLAEYDKMRRTVDSLIATRRNYSSTPNLNGDIDASRRVVNGKQHDLNNLSGDQLYQLSMNNYEKEMEPNWIGKGKGKAKGGKGEEVRQVGLEALEARQLAASGAEAAVDTKAVSRVVERVAVRRVIQKEERQDGGRQRVRQTVQERVVEEKPRARVREGEEQQPSVLYMRGRGALSGRVLHPQLQWEV